MTVPAIKDLVTTWCSYLASSPIMCTPNQPKKKKKKNTKIQIKKELLCTIHIQIREQAIIPTRNPQIQDPPLFRPPFSVES